MAGFIRAVLQLLTYLVVASACFWLMRAGFSHSVALVYQGQPRWKYAGLVLLLVYAQAWLLDRFVAGLAARIGRRLAL